MPMFQLFDKGIQVRMGQAHVKRWIDDIMPLVTDDADPLGTADLASHKIADRRDPRRLRDVPEEGRRGDEGRHRALTRIRRPSAAPCHRLGAADDRLRVDFLAAANGDQQLAER